jgi:hypothetical protein
VSAIDRLQYLAQEGHGPGRHGPVLVVLVLVVIVGALVYGLVRLVAKSRAGRTRSDRDPENDRTPGA